MTTAVAFFPQFNSHKERRRGEVKVSRHRVRTEVSRVVHSSQTAAHVLLLTVGCNSAKKNNISLKNGADLQVDAGRSVYCRVSAVGTRLLR